MDFEEGKTAVSDGKAPVPVLSKERMHDELFGRLVVVVLVLGLFSVLGFFVFLGYRIYENRRDDDPSIADIPKHEQQTEVVQEVRESAESKSSEEVSEQPDAKQSTISVLNGGGAKGSAGMLADILKKAGFSKVTAGNADGDYAGVTVFYQEGQESGAKAVLADIVKQYPKAVVSKADPNRKETGVAPITVVIGK